MASLPFVVDKGCCSLVGNRNYSLPFLSFSVKNSIFKIKATRKDYGQVGGADSDADGDGDGDAIQAAINKTHKLLAVQKQLINQVLNCLLCVLSHSDVTISLLLVCICHFVY